MPNIDQLTYAIKSEDSSGVAKALERISTALTALKSAQSGRWSNLTTISENITKLGAAVNNFPDDKLKKISNSLKSMSGAKVSVASVAKQTERAVKASQKVTDTLVTPAQTKSVYTDVGKKGKDGILPAETKTDKKDSTKEVVKAAKAKQQVTIMTGFAKRLRGMIQRRIIMAMISGVVDSVKQGMENLYNYSKENGTRYAKVMDAMSVSMTYFKDSLAAAVAPILEQVVPMIGSVLDKISAFNNEVARTIAYIKGESTYTKAIKGTASIANNVGSAASSAKELRNTLLGFDEINRLDADNRTGGGGGYGVSVAGNNLFAQDITGSKTLLDVGTPWIVEKGQEIASVIGDGVEKVNNSRFAEALEETSANIRKKVAEWNKNHPGILGGWLGNGSDDSYDLSWVFGMDDNSIPDNPNWFYDNWVIDLFNGGKKLFNGGKEKVTKAIDNVSGKIEKANESVDGFNAALKKYNEEHGVASESTEKTSNGLSILNGIFGKNKQTFDATLPSIKSTTSAIQGLGDWLSKIKNNPQIDATESSFRALGSTLNDKLHLDTVKATFASFFKGTTDSMTPAKTAADNTKTSFANLLNTALSNTKSDFASSGIGTFLSDMSAKARNDFKPSIDGVREALTSLFNKTSETPASANIANAAIKTVLDSVKNQFAPGVTNARNAYSGLTMDLSKSISTQPISAFCNTTNSNMDKLVQKFGEAGRAANNLKGIVETINSSGPKITIGSTWTPKTTMVQAYASGGTPTTGSLFIAGEAGAELVSRSAGGGTSVSNMDQLSASVSAGNVGVISAIYEMADILSTAIKDNSATISTGDIVSSLSRMSRRDGKAVAIA